jgi:RhtB (resistance to homoserine/threonine) family protein
MFGIHHYFMFIIAGILLNLTPGTDTLYIIARSISQGRKAGIYSSMGIAAGTLVHTLLAALGLSFLLAKSLILFTIIKMVGVVYLVYLGVNMIRSKSSSASLDPASMQPVNMQKIFFQGMITNVTNPKVGIFFLAFLPQFVDVQAHSPVPFILLGATFITTGTLWCITVSYFASFATGKLRRNPRIGLWLNRITGGLFILLGANLFRAKISS